MTCEHKEVKARIVIVQTRYYEKGDEGNYEWTQQESDEVDWDTAYIECLNCGSKLTPKDIGYS